jgi:predicted enzyme related to lactoylglutathione lyase
MRFNGICLNTKDVSALATFYQAVLNVPAEGDAHHAEVKTEPAGIAIFSLDGMEEMAPGSTQGLGCGSVTLMFQVDNADAEYQRIKALGVEIVKPPETYPWGARSFWFKDPDGNVIDFYMVVK